MINRLKQNRAQRPSGRQKFKGNNRATMHDQSAYYEKPQFKKIPVKQLLESIEAIRSDARLQKRRRRVVYVTFTLVFMLLLLLMFRWLY